MKQRRLGKNGPLVSALGLGCMGMSWAYGDTSDEAAAIAVIHRALELGINFLDTAEVYGPYTNEELVGRAIKGKREQFVIATKFGFRIEDGKNVGADSRPDNVRKVCDESLKRLGVDEIDLFYQHRVDPAVAIEETVGAMAELVRAGKVKYLGLSEAGADSIRRAHKTHPITALQSEYSLWERGIEEKILPTIRELGIGLVPYSPLGRGFLTGEIKRFEDFAPTDFRRTLPRFQGENFARNLKLVDEVKAMASEKGVTAGQVALAFILAQGEDIVPIPGTKRIKYLEENAAALDVTLSAAEQDRLRGLAALAAGDRYLPPGMAMVGR